MPSPDSPGSRGLDFDTLTQQGEAASRPFDPAASAGLFVGVRQFVDADEQPSQELLEIPFAVDDAIDLAALFVFELALLEAPRVRLLLSGEPQKPASQQSLSKLRGAGARMDRASKTKVLSGLRGAAKEAGASGLLVISMATHGYSLRGEYLLCNDTLKSDLADTSLAWSSMESIVLSSPCERRVLLLDACRQNLERHRSASAGAEGPTGLAQAIRVVKGMAVLCGAPPGGYSFDDPERENGVFTARVLEGLRTGAPSNNEGLVTLQSLAVWVDSQVVAWIKANKPHLPSAQGITLRLEPQGIGNLPLASRGRRDSPHNPLLGLDGFLKATLTLYQSLPLIGVNPELKLTLGVDDVYVPLKGVRSRNIFKPNIWQGEHGPERIEEDIDLAQAFTCCEAAEEKYRKRGIIILGDPGSGKTTLLKLLLVRCIKEGGTALGLPADIVPVMLPLRDLKGDADLDTFFSRHLKENTHLNLSAEFPRALRESRPLLYLLDGLDEVPDEAERARVSRWIQSGLTSHTRAYFAVTCRYAGYQGDARLDDHFVELNVRPLKEPEAQALVKNFYRIVERHQHGDTHLATVNAKERSEHLWGLLCGESFRTRRMREMQSNPLLLTIVCLVHQRYNDLPDRRWRLYEQCVDTLLWHWRKAIGLKLPFDLEESRRFLLPLAWWLHQSVERRHATSAELVAAIQEPLSLLNVTPERLVQFLKDVRDRSGLLVGWSADSYGFIHLGFQEHLAALHLKNASHGNISILDEAARHFGESWWTEVLLLLVSLPEPPLFEPFMRRVLAGDAFARQEHRQLLSDVVADASVRSPMPFLEVAGNPARSEEARYAALWAIRGMKEEQQGQVIAACRPLVEDSRSSLGALARELLAERGVTVEEPLRAGSLWVHKATGLEFVYVPPGRFRMGSNDGDDDEKPIHEVEFKRGFWIGKYPVTNAQYGQFMEETQHQEPEYWQNRELNGPEQPVVGVAWNDAIAFTRWADGRLVEEDGYAPDGANRLHLPSEAEWEYGTRGPESRKYPWGDADPTPELANFASNVGRTTPVGQYPKGASWVGALDMAGNVWEWCLDTYQPYNDKVTVVDPIVIVGDSSRVLRGGAWSSDTDRLRGANRSRFRLGNRYGNLGFRVVCVSVSAEHGLDLDP